jgi:hypothetical protein
MQIRNTHILILALFLVLTAQIIYTSPVSASGNYFASGTVTSTNLLSGNSASLITNFHYTLSSLPGDSSASIQFSNDNTNWYSAAGVLNGTTALSTIGGANISLSSLNWSGTSFYYKITLNSTSDNTGTPIFTDIRLDYTPTDGYNSAFNVISSNGNIGIGTTSPAQKLEVNGISQFDNNIIQLGNGGNFSLISGVGGLQKWGIYDGVASAYRLTINSSGNVGIGTTAPTNILSLGGTAARTIWMERNTTVATAGQGLTLSSGGAAVGTADLAGGDLTLKSGTATGVGSSAMHFYTATASSTGTSDNTPTEKMTILGSGNVGIGTTGPANILHVTGAPASGTSVVQIANTLGGTTQNNGLLVLAGNNTGVAASQMITFERPDATVIGSISQNAAATVAFNTSSDRRIKENIVPTTYGLSDLLKINVLDFNFISDPSKQKTTGFIAQDLNGIYPNAVTPNGDNGTDPLAQGKTPWMVDYSKLTPLLVKSIQDLNLTLDNIAGTITPLAGSQNETFVNSFFTNVENKLSAWMGNVGNNIGDFFANKVRTKEICVSDNSGETCLTRGQLNNLMGTSGESTTLLPAAAPVTVSTPTLTTIVPTAPTPTPATSTTTTTTPDTTSSTSSASSAPAPIITPTPSADGVTPSSSEGGVPAGGGSNSVSTPTSTP